MSVFFAVFGILFSGIGSFLIGLNDIVTRQRLIGIAYSKIEGVTEEEILEIPAIREMIRRRRNRWYWIIYHGNRDRSPCIISSWLFVRPKLNKESSDKNANLHYFCYIQYYINKYGQ